MTDLILVVSYLANKISYFFGTQQFVLVKIPILWVVILCHWVNSVWLLGLFGPEHEVTMPSKCQEIFLFTPWRRNFSEDSKHQDHCCENLKSCIILNHTRKSPLLYTALSCMYWCSVFSYFSKIHFSIILPAMLMCFKLSFLVFRSKMFYMLPLCMLNEQ
jgi:hypothetical protein